MMPLFNNEHSIPKHFLENAIKTGDVPLLHQMSLVSSNTPYIQILQECDGHDGI